MLRLSVDGRQVTSVSMSVLFEGEQGFHELFLGHVNAKGVEVGERG